jgi:hypothetical protein
VALRESEVPAPLVPVVLAQVQVLAQLRPRPQVPVALVLPAHLVVEPAGAVQLLSRQSFSAAIAGSTPKLRATYEPVPRSR